MKTVALSSIRTDKGAVQTTKATDSVDWQCSAEHHSSRRINRHVFALAGAGLEFYDPVLFGK